jgi:hypothetical protein
MAMHNPRRKHHFLRKTNKFVGGLDERVSELVSSANVESDNVASVEIASGVTDSLLLSISDNPSSPVVIFPTLAVQGCD